MSAHRYWRLYIQRAKTPFPVVIDELDLRESAGGSRLTSTGLCTVTASDTLAGGYAASGVLDGIPHINNTSDQANAWYSMNDTLFNKWLLIDFGFGNEYDINYCAITNVGHVANAAAGSVAMAVLQHSDDAVTFTNRIYIFDTSDAASAVNVFETVPLLAERRDIPWAALGANPPVSHILTLANYFLTFSVYSRGKGFIHGTVKIDSTPDIPVRRRVVIFREPEITPLGLTWSDPITGEFDFLYLDEEGRYTTMAYDHNKSYRAVVADNIKPEV